MTIDLVHPPPRIAPDEALKISQQAPVLLRSSRNLHLPWPLSLFSNDDTQDKWTRIENLYVSCLRTGDDDSARALLDQIVQRFGEKNERVMAYQGMWAESRITSTEDFIRVLKEYTEKLKEDPTNMWLQKRRIALLRSMGKIQEATQQLVNLVECSPTDAEVWAELSSLYEEQELYEQAIFAMEEVLLIMPNAWNMHAKLAELIYRKTAFSQADSKLDQARGYAESMRRYCRSIELCDGYLRGYYGLKLATSKLLETLPDAGPSTGAPSVSTVERLNELATSKLAEIVRRGSKMEKGWDGYDKAELIAARELLNRDASAAPR